MAALQIALPKKLKSFVDEQAAEAGCSPGAFVKQILQHYQREKELKRLRSFLLTGIRQVQRGEAREMTEMDWQRLHNRLPRRPKGRK